MTKVEATKMFTTLHWGKVIKHFENNDCKGVDLLWSNFLKKVETEGHKVRHTWDSPNGQHFVEKWLACKRQPKDYVKSAVPTEFVEYKITFINLAVTSVIMTDSEWNGMSNSKIWTFIKNVEGCGYHTKV